MPELTIPIRRGLAAVLLAGAALAASIGRADAACAIQTTAEMPLRDSFGFLSIPATINGMPASLLVDTGAEAGLITQEAAERFNLPPDPSRASRIEGTGGFAAPAPHAILAGLTIGGLTVQPHSVPIGPLPALPRIEPPVAGLLGADVLAHFDVEIDVPRSRLALHAVSDACAAPLRAPYEVVPLRRAGNRLIATAVLDGHPLEALLDTGALSVALDADTATRVLGVSPEALARDPGGIAGGVDMRELPFHWHRFASLAIGPVLTRNPVITVTPLHEDTPMLLGSSWFATRHVWLSYTAARMFVRR